MADGKGTLSSRQSAFVMAYIENKGNATQAAIQAGYSEGAAKVQASRLLTYDNVSEAIKESQEVVAEKHNVTVDSLILELQEAKKIALGLGTPQVSAAISAIMGKAKICGLDKLVVDNTSSDGSMSPKGFNDFYNED